MLIGKGFMANFFLDETMLFYYNSSSAQKRAEKSCNKGGAYYNENDISTKKETKK